MLKILLFILQVVLCVYIIVKGFRISLTSKNSGVVACVTSIIVAVINLVGSYILCLV